MASSSSSSSSSSSTEAVDLLDGGKDADTEMTDAMEVSKPRVLFSAHGFDLLYKHFYCFAEEHKRDNFIFYTSEQDKHMARGLPDEDDLSFDFSVKHGMIEDLGAVIESMRYCIWRQIRTRQGLRFKATKRTHDLRIAVICWGVAGPDDSEEDEDD